MGLLLSIFILVLIVILVFGTKKALKGEFHNDFLSIRVTNGLKGYAAIGIMLHHLTQTITQYGNIQKGVINIFNDFGVLYVGTFFFLSGYGLFTSFRIKDNYLDHFFKRRLPAVLIPFYMANTIFIIFSLMSGMKLRIGQLISCFTGWLLLNTQLWYIVEIVFLYLLFYLCFRYIKNKNISYALMGVLIILLSIGSLLLGHDNKTFCGGAWFKGEWWYNTTLLFFVGITISKYETEILKQVKKYYTAILLIGICGFILLFSASEYMLIHAGYWCEGVGNPGYTEKFMTLGAQLPMVIVYVLLFLLITFKFQFKNKVLHFLGNISLELYLIHNLFITWFNGRINNDFFYILVVYTCSILLAVVLKYIDTKIITSIKG